ncbi:GntR family transcriptional regulator [Castellaniella sp.]|uniref:GntR family transcriptional regulator n=1 Tax=Castellaniella sp. TaxID=1955812 RepID=UPI00355DB553
MPAKKTSRPTNNEAIPLGERAYRHIRNAIQSGDLSPGDRLREVDLAKLIGLSRTPIREALARLESEGLVTHDPIRGIMVAELDYSMITELYYMREVLEGTAARLAAQHASNVEISILEDLCHEYEAAIGNDSVLSLRNRQFHDTLYRCSHNRYLINILTILHDTLMLLGPSTLRDLTRAKQTLAEHRAVVQAIKERDPETAEAELRAHIHNAQKLRLKQLFAPQAKSVAD